MQQQKRSRHDFLVLVTEELAFATGATMPCSHVQLPAWQAMQS
jgi:hypothetical protein